MRLVVFLGEPLRRLCAAFVEYRLGDELEREPDADGQQDGLFEQAQHRNEIRNQIDGAEGVGDDTDREQLCGEWRLRMANKTTA